MRRSRALAAGAAAAAVAVALAAPTATAWDSPSNIAASPGVVAPGGRMTVTVDGSACQRPGSTVESRVFPRTRLTSLGGNTARATVTIDSTAQPGSYAITARCGDATLTRPDAFTVVGGVRGGIGGSSTSGATATDIAIGSGLVTLAAIGGGVFWLRRRTERA